MMGGLVMGREEIRRQRGQHVPRYMVQEQLGKTEGSVFIALKAILPIDERAQSMGDRLSNHSNSAVSMPCNVLQKRHPQSIKDVQCRLKKKKVRLDRKW